jgi:hypothetical protein
MQILLSERTPHLRIKTFQVKREKKEKKKLVMGTKGGPDSKLDLPTDRRP